LKLVVRIPGVQRVMGHVIGIGIRPEHLRKQARGHLLIGVGCGVGVALALIGRRRQFMRSR
jgi:hypothetical protein